MRFRFGGVNLSEKLQLQLLSTLYVTLLYVFVSLSGTYDITYMLLGKPFGVSKSKWVPPVGGSSLKSIGFWVHIIVFFVLVLLPMVYCSDRA